MKKLLNFINMWLYYFKRKIVKPNIEMKTMSRLLRFEKDPDGRWYVILPEWKGPKAALQMVAGADTLLDILSKGNYITLEVTNSYHTNLKWLTKSYTCVATSSHGDYHLVDLNMDLWLCSVNEFVWGGHPECIYFRVVTF